VVADASGDDGDRAPEAVARLLRDVDFAALLRAQCRRLREDSAEARAEERALLQASEWRDGKGRAQFSFVGAGIFEDYVIRIDDGDRSYLWVYEEDGTDPPEPGEEPYTAARDRLLTAWQDERTQRVHSIRLCLFSGTSRMAEALAQLGAAARVTHVELRTNEPGTEHAPIARSFPAVRGLTCADRELAPLLAEGAPRLRSLVVTHPWDQPHVAIEARLPDVALPDLRHFGLFHGPCSAEDLAVLAAHPMLRSLASLEIFSLNHATRFPFDALLDRRDAWAHLRRVLVTGHLVPDDIKRRFAAWPEVELVGYDRREVIAFDFETRGWAAGAR
jgi:hypothetical protein